MNVHTMMALLSIRLEDAEGSIFTESERLQFINNAQLKLSQALHNNYLTELQVIETNESVTSNKFAMSNLDNTVLRGGEGILKVKLASGKYCTRIDVKDIKRTENQFYQGSATNPLYYVFQNNIYVLFGGTSTLIDVYYLKLSTTLQYKLGIGGNLPADAVSFKIDSDEEPSSVDDYYNGAVIYSVDKKTYHVVTDYVGSTRLVTVEPAATSDFSSDTDEIYFLPQDFDSLALSGIDCDLNESLHEIIVSLAEAEGWAMDSKLDRRESALRNANSIINVLNARYTEAEGIGTKNR